MATTGGGQPDAGISAPLADAGPGLGVGAPCAANGVVDPCTPAALVCDNAAGRCRLPEVGERCSPPVGCGPFPSSLGCYTPQSQSDSLCLVPCTSSDSSGCPYGTSCGDPDLAGFCSSQGSPACTPWTDCALSSTVSGDCVPNGSHSACFASGALNVRDGPCDPHSTNGDSQRICAKGLVCLAGELGLAQTGSAGGFCFPLCGADAGVCLVGEHCDQPNAAIYGVCRAGIGCRLDADTCPANRVCVPDQESSLAGGCQSIQADAGSIGDACNPPNGPTAGTACRRGTCLPSAAGNRCTALCDLADGGRPYCVNEVCTPLNPGDSLEVVGECQ